MRFLPTLHILSRIALLFSFTLLAPIALAWFNHDQGLMPFVHALALLAGSSIAVMALTSPFRRELAARDGFFAGHRAVGVATAGRLRATDAVQHAAAVYLCLF